MSLFLGIDTSNYTTSAALYEDTGACSSVCRPLEVSAGKTGLRQSDALFLHIRQLPQVLDALDFHISDISAVGVSSRPSDREGSYMPCFLAGQSLAQCLGHASRIPVFEFSHQQGHIAAAAWSCGKMELISREHLAWHLSGGTTELLHVIPDAKSLLRVNRLGGTLDLTAGQLIDRAGHLLGLGFPAGKELDALSRTQELKDYYPVKVSDCSFSLSGLENKAEKMLASGESRAHIASYLLYSVCHAVNKATTQAQQAYPGLPVLCSGGVSANTLLRMTLENTLGAVFAKPEFSSDNAAGPAILAALSYPDRESR